jgi:protein-S-isoprenylcysteine O-methyltransferase Ste14
MVLRDRLQRLLKLRFAILYPIGFYLALAPNIYPDGFSLRCGVPVLLAGVMMRLWSNGYAIKMGKLTISGPYAIVRNPLYVGTALIILGFAVILKILLPGVIFFVAFVLVYRRTIMSEEKMLADKFGEAYLEYKRVVPALFPTMSPYVKGEKWPFSWQRLWESREHKIFIWMSLTVIGFYLKTKLAVEHESIDQGMVWLMVGAISLVVLDVLGELVRRKQKIGVDSGV